MPPLPMPPPYGCMCAHTRACTHACIWLHAAAAQVHRATLDGSAVAVKVRHPGVVTRIITDFTLMRLLADGSSKVSRDRFRVLMGLVRVGLHTRALAC